MPNSIQTILAILIAASNASRSSLPRYVSPCVSLICTNDLNGASGSSKCLVYRYRLTANVRSKVQKVPSKISVCDRHARFCMVETVKRIEASCRKAGKQGYAFSRVPFRFGSFRDEKQPKRHPLSTPCTVIATRKKG